ncbi:MAG: hypothetical protein IKL74_06045 [Clostridia bacterium]|nr:hypothetical protein [Clostridia bacterium]
MIKITKGLYIHFTFFIIFAASFFAGTFFITAMAFLTAMCHELCHLAAALLLKEKCHGIAIMPYGCKLFVNTGKDPLKECLVAVAGPAFNLLMLLFFREGPLFEINLAMSIINLFPVMPLDGGRIVFILVSFFVGSFKALSLMKIISVSGGVILSILGVFQAFTAGFNLSVFTSGAFLLFAAIADNGKTAFFADVLISDDKLKDGYAKVFMLAAKESLSARRILSLIPPGKYALIKVIDCNGNIKSEITEDMLKEKIIEKGAGVHLREIT